MKTRKTVNANRCAKLDAQRERNDEKARASAVRQMSSNSDAQIGASSVLAQAGTPSAPAEVALQPGEVYAGVTIWPNGAPYHLILSPEDKRITGIYEAESIVRGMDKDLDLPTFCEMAILLKRMPNEFQPALYHTGDEEECEGGTMPVFFDATPAGQSRRDEHELRLRSIRRVWADDASTDFAAIMTEQREITHAAARTLAARLARSTSVIELSAQQVGQLANRLIDAEALSSEASSTADEHLVSAAVKIGIMQMATALHDLLDAGVVPSKKQG